MCACTAILCAVFDGLFDPVFTAVLRTCSMQVYSHTHSYTHTRTLTTAHLLTIFNKNIWCRYLEFVSQRTSRAQDSCCDSRSRCSALAPRPAGKCKQCVRVQSVCREDKSYTHAHTQGREFCEADMHVSNMTVHFGLDVGECGSGRGGTECHWYWTFGADFRGRESNFLVSASGTLCR